MNKQYGSVVCQTRTVTDFTFRCAKCSIVHKVTVNIKNERLTCCGVTYVFGQDQHMLVENES